MGGGRTPALEWALLRNPGGLGEMILARTHGKLRALASRLVT